MSLQVHHLSCGSMCPHGAKFLFPTTTLCCHCLAVETSAGLVLADTGLPRRDLQLHNQSVKTWVTQADRNDENSMVAQLKIRGFSVDDVRHIVLTHLDWDHSGGLRDFPRALVHMHEAEARFIRDENGPSFRYDPRVWEHGLKMQSYARFGEKWNGFQAVRPLEGLPEEILLVPLLGHSPGHSGIAIESDQGPLLHAGDAFFFREDIGKDVLRRSTAGEVLQTVLAFDNSLRVQTLRKLQKVQEKATVRVINSHDPRLLP